MSAVTPFEATLPASAFTEAAADFKKTLPPVNTGGNFLKLRRTDGVWVYGKDGVEVEDESQWAVNPHSISKGFIAWHAGRPEGEKMARIGQPAILAADLPPVSAKNGWEVQVGFDLVCISGEDTDVEVNYKTNTQGGIGAFDAIFNALSARAAAGQAFVPIVELGETNYNHPENGLIYKPVFKIVGWAGDETTAIEDEEAPKRRRKAK
jgi:hypothetical protein